jgi:hypothetical protein
LVITDLTALNKLFSSEINLIEIMAWTLRLFTAMALFGCGDVEGGYFSAGFISGLLTKLRSRS